MTRRPAIAAVILFAMAPLAHGAPAWTPWSITELDPAASGEVIALSPGGHALIAAAFCSTAGCESSVAARAPGGALTRTATLPGGPVASAPLTGGAALVLTTPPTRRGLVAVDVTAGGAVGRTAVVTRSTTRASFAASNGNGAAAVAWLANRLPQRLGVPARTRDGAPLGRPRTLARFAREGDFGGGAAAVSAQGDVAVLWATNRALLARVWQRGEPGFGPVLRAGPSDRRAQIAPAFNSRGTLVTIWRSADGGEEQNRVAVVRVASLRRGARAFVHARRLGEGAHEEALGFGHGVAVRAVAAGRTANVAWTSRSLQVKLATVHDDGAVTAVRVLDPSGVLVDATGSATGRALIAWTHDPLGPQPSARAVLRVSPRRLGPVEPVGPAPNRATGVALDAAGTRALVTWGAADPVLSSRWGIAERPVR